MAKKEEQLNRREAIKTIGTGVGVIASLPVLGGTLRAQELAAHDHSRNGSQATAPAKAQPLKFFTDEENKTVLEMSERIIPADDNSPGAKAARVNEYIDLIVSESPAAINKMSTGKFGKAFAQTTIDQQVEILKEISRNEKSPQTVEERFFRTIKYATIDGYYTSEIGIHKELHYKGNAYLKEFTGCTHPEHQQ